MVEHDQVIGGGVAASVPGTKYRREGLAGVVQPRPERVMAVPTLEGAVGAFSIRVRAHERRIQVDHDLFQDPGRSRFGWCGRLPVRAGRSGPPLPGRWCAGSHRSSCPDPLPDLALGAGPAGAGAGPFTERS